MSTLFELSATELHSLLLIIRPNIQMDRNDAPSMQSKVTEWLLLNNLSTLHKFTKNGEEWIVPSKLTDCQSCKDFKIQHKFVPQIVVSQPTQNGENLITFDVKAGKPILPPHRTETTSIGKREEWQVILCLGVQPTETGAGGSNGRSSQSVSFADILLITVYPFRYA